jgi:hypothetical protein
MIKIAFIENLFLEREKKINPLCRITIFNHLSSINHHHSINMYHPMMEIWRRKAHGSCSLKRDSEIVLLGWNYYY